LIVNDEDIDRACHCLLFGPIRSQATHVAGNPYCKERACRAERTARQ
jgi:hypothetical protein